MPYIKPAERKELNIAATQAINALVMQNGNIDRMTLGQLNYLITSMLVDIVERRGKSYTIYNELIGVLECVKLELYRRAVASYEDKKIQENGDVY